jgi:hypothetical protein
VGASSGGPDDPLERFIELISIAVDAFPFVSFVIFVVTVGVATGVVYIQQDNVQQGRSQSWIVNETFNLLSTGLRHCRALHA